MQEITLEKLQFREDYHIGLNQFLMDVANGNRLIFHFRGHTEETMVIVGDYSCNYFRLTFEADAILLRSPDLYELKEDVEINPIPLLTLTDSKLLTFARKMMGLDPTKDWVHYWLRAFEQDFHVLSPRPPVLTDLGHKRSDAIVTYSFDSLIVE